MFRYCVVFSLNADPDACLRLYGKGNGDGSGAGHQLPGVAMHLCRSPIKSVLWTYHVSVSPFPPLCNQEANRPFVPHLWAVFFTGCTDRSNDEYGGRQDGAPVAPAPRYGTKRRRRGASAEDAMEVETREESGDGTCLGLVCVCVVFAWSGSAFECVVFAWSGSAFECVLMERTGACTHRAH
jgi:hypothetical protein